MTVPLDHGPDAAPARLRTVLSRITQGELLTLLAVGIFAELLTVGWIVAIFNRESSPYSWEQAFGLVAVDFVALAWLPVPLFTWYDWFPLGGARHVRHAAMRVLGAVIVLFVSSWLSMTALHFAGNAYGVRPDVLGVIAPGYPEQLFWAACAVFGVSIAYLVLRRLHGARELEQRNAELQRLTLEARLNALAAELHPHFLFNALNNLAELVHHDPARAEAMLLHLSSLLQATLTTSRQRTVPLAEELQLLDDYLAIQRMRFEDRLQVTSQIEPSVMTVRIPPMLLQPLVENAVVHGIEGRVGASQLRITIRANVGLVEVEVDDDGPGPGGSAHRGTGTGLQNVRGRLAALYGEVATADLIALPGGGARAVLRFPMESE
ncbi:sensor histidine kinase [Gemmatimonas sp.]|uniref:sensor histidine kinase n=1 Tax=Gemmatimonas sp. TaxID=1962908 RepID=UPI0037C0EFE1